MEPIVDFLQRLGVQRVDAALLIDLYAGEPVVPQNPKMLRNGGLCNAELVLDDLDNIAGTSLALREQHQDASPYRIAENVEGVHSLPV
nr:hypothetical protein [Cohnella sp. REN36]